MSRTNALVERGLIQDLCLPRAYAHPVAEVRCVPTPRALSFCAGSYVYRLLLPLCSAPDPHDLEARRARCEATVASHHGLAPGVYLGVVPIVRSAAGYLQFEGQGEVVDHAIRLRRLPEEEALDRVLLRTRSDEGQLREVARALAGWHLTAPADPTVTCRATPEKVRAQLEAGFAAVEAHVSPRGSGEVLAPLPTTPTLLRFVQGRQIAALEAHLETFARRQREGRIREGHGRLRAPLVFCPPTGPCFLHRAERAAERCGDVLADLAGLLVDLDLRGARKAADFLFDAWREETGDPDALELIAFYKSVRAWQRGQEAMQRALEAPSGEGLRRLALEEARAAFSLAAAYLLPPAVILLCGLPGSGKSWVANHLAPVFDSVLLRAVDACRSKAMLPTAGPGLCHCEAHEEAETYAHLEEQARYELAHGKTVLVEAPFLHRRERESFLDLARRAHHPFLLVEVSVDRPTALRRLEERAAESELARHQVEVAYAEAARSFEPPHEVPAFARIATDGQLSPGEVALMVLHRLTIHEPLSASSSA